MDVADKEFSEYIFVLSKDQEVFKSIEILLRSHAKKVRHFSTPEEMLVEVRKKRPAILIVGLPADPFLSVEFFEQLTKPVPHLKTVLWGTASEQEATSKFVENKLAESFIDPTSDSKNFDKKISELIEKRIAEKRADLLDMGEIIDLFTEEATQLFGDLDQLLLQLEQIPLNVGVVDILFRKIHSVKGGANSISITQILGALNHEFESALTLVKKGELLSSSDTINVFLVAADLSRKLIEIAKTKEEPSDEIVDQVFKCIDNFKDLKKDGNLPHSEAQSTQPTAVLAKDGASNEKSQEENGVWVSNEKLDSFMRLSGELIVLKNYFRSFCKDNQHRVDESMSRKLNDFTHSINKISDNQQAEIMSVRKVSLDHTFKKLPRIVRQTSQDLGKKVKLVMIGTDLGVDKTIANVLSACMTHMVRNCVDHGLEGPHERESCGKSHEGNVEIRAVEDRGIIQITVSDDGRGIDRQRILNKAIQNGLLPAEKKDSLRDHEIFDLLFLPGFSTAEKITNISGRGVGLDVVRSEILNLNGTVRLDSESGKGSRFTLEIPVPKTVVVEQAVITKYMDTLIAVPLSAVAKIVSCKDLTFNEMNHIKTTQFNDKTISVGTYSQLMSRNYDDWLDVDSKTLLVLSHKDKTLGLLVDSIQDQIEAVIRPFGALMKNLPGFKGTTVLGDDSIAYVVSPEDFSNLDQRSEKCAEVA
jgi:two-component system chemotaxis sensor kinase CheA